MKESEIYQYLRDQDVPEARIDTLLLSEETMQGVYNTLVEQGSIDPIED